MRVLVTGGSGFIGTNLVESLARRHEVLSYDVVKPRIPAESFIWQRGSVMDGTELAKAYEDFQPELVFHLAARTDLDGAHLTDYEANTRGVLNLIQSARKLRNRPHTVYASSRLIFDILHRPASVFDYKPSTVYGESKVEFEKIIRREASSAGTWTVVRPTSIWGPWFGVPYRDFFDRVRRRQYVHLAGVRPLKSYGYVGNAVHQLERLGLTDPSIINEQFYWLADYRPIDLSMWANMVADAFGVRRPLTVPIAPLRVAAGIGDMAKRLGWLNPPLTSFRLQNLQANMEYDTSRTEAIVGALPFSLEQGVLATVKWMLEQGDPKHGF